MRSYFLFILLFMMPVFAIAEIILENVFTNKEYHYSIHYPGGWKATDQRNGAVIFNDYDAPSKHLMINIQTIYTKKGGGKYKNIKDLMDDFWIQVPMHTQDAKFLERKPLNLEQPGGKSLSGEETTLTFRENGTTWKQWQIMLINSNGILFQALAYRAPLAIFDAYRPIAASMLASWIMLE